MTNQFQELCEAFDTIIIFRHQVGDGDALGAQFGLKMYLEDKYPNKTIYATGDVENGFMHLFPAPDVIQDEEFDNALAIVVDTANQARIDDDRYQRCPKLIKIDHHLEVDKFGDLQIVNEEAASASEIVVEILKELENNEPLIKSAAEYLYLGIISDTQSFSISSVSKQTFAMAMYLLDSDIDISDIKRRLTAQSKEMFEFKTFLQSKVNFTKHSMAYLTISNEDLAKFKIKHNDAKENVGIMKNIEGVEVWALFIEQEGEDAIYNGSIRSHRIRINDVAEKYGGGGHKQAAGVKGLTAKDLASIIYLLDTKTV